MSVGTYPAHQVDFAPGVASSAIPGAGDWVEITSKVLEWFCKWGTEDEFSQPGAGTADLLLDNADGDFDTDYSSGPYFGDLLPGVWFRIKAGTTTADTDVFYGQASIDGFQIAASQHADSVVRVRLVDASEFFANTDLPRSAMVVETETDSPSLWWRLSESDGTQATDSSGNGRHGTYGGGATANSTEGIAFFGNDDDHAIEFDGVDDVVTYSSFTPGNAWSIEVWVKAAAQSGAPAIICLLGGGSPNIGEIVLYEQNGSGAKLEYRYTHPSTGSSTVYRSIADVFDGNWHHVVVAQNGATTSLFVDSVEGKTLESGAAANITWGAMSVTVGSDNQSPNSRHVAGNGAFFAGTIDEVIVYNSVLTSARVLQHFIQSIIAWSNERTSTRVGRLLDLVGYDASHRNINTGQSRIQGATLGGDAWSALLDVAKTEAGAIYVDHQDAGKVRFIDRQHRWSATASLTSQVTIGDGGGAQVPADDIDLADDRIINEASIQRAGGAAVIVEDATSKATFRDRTLSETGLLYMDDAESQARGERIVNEKKDRRRRVRSVTLQPRKSTHPAWSHVFARKMNDRITVKWQPPYGGLYEYAAWIIGIDQRWRRGGGLTTTWSLARVPFDTEPNDAPYWIAGTSLAGVDTRPGY